MKRQFVAGALAALTAFQVPVVAQANNQDVGTIIGGIVGGIIGNQVGSGDGRAIATGIGIVVGAVIGNQLGKAMDDADRRAYREAQDRAFRGRVSEVHRWDGRGYGSRTGAYGEFVTIRDGYHYQSGRVCREYRSVIIIGQRREENTGIACSYPDGRWVEVHTREVRWNGGGTFVPAPGPGYPAPYPGPGRPGPGRPGPGRGTYEAIYDFATSDSGLYLTRYDAEELADRWVRRGCESGRHINNVLAPNFERAFRYARSPRGLGMNSNRARIYALKQIQYDTDCYQLLRNALQR